MKFLCDRCKTRYSIGDDRVRGKILKIRCKNCANVITVREGMTGDPDAPVALERAARKKATTGAPEALNEAESARGVKEPARADRLRDQRAAPGDDAGRAQAGAARKAAQEPRRAEPVNALGAAFASAMAKPPPALDEEWYVSIDGEQSGPFSLAEAQHWVAQKPFDAELHCWSEGFDDWLPVDKVSHFRGLRKRPPAPGAPPPLPRLIGATQRAAATPVEEEPKPLFAATMASLERGAPVASSPGIQLPPPASAPARATPSHDAPAAPRTNGVRNAPAPAVAPVAARESRAPDPRPAATRPSGSASRRGKPAVDPFDSSDENDAPTQIEPMPFDPLLAPRRGEPAGKPRDPAPGSSDAALTTPHLPASAAPAIGGETVRPASSDFEGDTDDGDLAIGEVSRVVNLGDIARSRSERPATARARTGVNPMFRSTGTLARLPGLGDAVPGLGEAPGAPVVPVARSHRRGLIALLSVASVMLLGVIGAVILFVTTDDDPIGSRLREVRDIDTSRPDQRIAPRPPTPAPANPPSNPPLRTLPRVSPSPQVTPELAPPSGDSLSAEEVEDMARKHQDVTNRCYMRAQRGVDSILIGDVKKIAVTMTIGADGSVSDIQLSDHAANNLGKCLTVAIRGWRFRPSAGGTYRFSLNFVGG